ncbi:PLAC8-domain-containing protein [Aspergillus uvarum CBS 121591]|uniref:PLAC8-domain-containing protein n=1 Tax=Aspergillus uvarum CBS 121591 TaxID=1448315 RepID=A0A319CAI3_9EURO|nr:PLAC8-domain-containing protein [Aspergillus uvarum CBS 121591]PYH81059.1 PLAC8-domain-containing protein [Aspergillus uvarum CBS 121591]
MADTQKVYRPWPAEPPTYQHANSEDIQKVTHNKEWNYSLFDCCSPASLCLTSCCLPCLAFGKTQARVQDPKLEGYSSVNGDCMIFTFLSFGYAQWIYQCIKRGEMRQKYGIEGSCCGDCCVTFCCSCCALVQEEKEAELRTRPDLAGYQMAPQMEFSQK